MRTRMTLAAVVTAAAGALLGWLAIRTTAQDRKPQPDAKTKSSFTLEELARRSLHRSAVDAVVWGMPAVNFDLMYQAMVESAKGGPNQIVYWSGLPGWKNQTLTPNPDVIYLMPFFDTKEAGPMVIEIPPADGGVINGTIMDCWQAPLEDVGPAGADKGKGGKYLVLPPGHKEKIPDGYVPLPSGNYRGYALLRSILKSGSKEDLGKAVAYGKRIKLYPLSQAKEPPPTKFVDALGVVFDSKIPYDLRFFRSLDRMVQAEPWLQRDRVMIDRLKSLGIQKGKKFAPDEKTRETLKEAAEEARALLDGRYEESFLPYFDDSRWALPSASEYLKAASAGFADPDSYPVEQRGLVFTFAYFTPKRLGPGQYYLMTIKDEGGDAFDGGATYRLTVPAKVPVEQFWSVTVYDRATHALIPKLSHPSRSSQTPGLKENKDGSVDLYFGPKAPQGKGSNWIPTSADGKFEVLFRFYGPTKPLFDKKWKLPDVVKVK